MSKKKTEELAVSLPNLMDGAAVVMFDRAMEEVVKDMMDPEKVRKQKRKIVLTFTITPRTKGKLGGSTDLKCTQELADRISEDGQINVGLVDGQYVAVEWDTGQFDVFDTNKSKVTPINIAGKAEEGA